MQRDGGCQLNGDALKEQICDVCHRMWQQGWVAANDGNVSVKLPDGTFWITPSGISKSFITPEKLLRVNAAMEVLEGPEGNVPSSELKMHMRCYEKRDDVGAVVHAHPPTATVTSRAISTSAGPEFWGRGPTGPVQISAGTTGSRNADPTRSSTFARGRWGSTAPSHWRPPAQRWRRSGSRSR